MNPAVLAEALALVADGSTAKEAAETMRLAGKSISWRTIYNAQTDGRAAALASSPPAASPPAAQKLVAYRPSPRAGAPPSQASPAPSDADDEESAAPDINAGGTPLEVMRALLAAATKTIRKLPADSARLGPRLAEARALAKGIEAIESKLAAVETPEEAERRRRAEDGETRKEIERHVLRAEAEAAAPRLGAPHGTCITCSKPLEQACS